MAGQLGLKRGESQGALGWIRVTLVEWLEVEQVQARAFPRHAKTTVLVGWLELQWAQCMPELLPWRDSWHWNGCGPGAWWGGGFDGLARVPGTFQTPT